MKENDPKETWHKTACVLCSSNCGLEVRLDGTEITRVRGNKTHVGSKGYTCEKALRVNFYQNFQGRITTPLKRLPDGSHIEVDWDTAIAEEAEGFKEVKQMVFCGVFPVDSTDYEFLKDKYFYVWVDALINYASAVGYGVDDSLFAKWWPADLHVIGKDITRFHCVVWPAMLMSAGLPLPGQVFGHGWVHWRGQKMSKSLGTVVDPLEAADRLGPDPLRFYLAKEIAFGQDGDFTWERFEDRYNVDLANNFGNLVSRVVSMVHRYRQGRLIVPSREPGPLARKATEAVAAYREAMDSYALQQGIEAALSLVDATNEYITTVEPWVVAKDPGREDELDRQLCDMAESVRIAATLLSPVMPSACREVLSRVGTLNGADELDLGRDGVWATPPGAERYLVKGPALWPRLEEGVLTMNENDAQKPIQGKKEPISVVANLPEETRISIDQFFKVKLRVGRIVMAEAVPKSKKLLRLEVESGSGIRQIVSGIAKSYTPESLVGRHVVYVENLKPAKLMGIESNGMVLAATDANGEAVLIEPEDVIRAPAGSEVK